MFLKVMYIDDFKMILCTLFFPKQTGKLQLYDVAAGVLLEKIDAHEDAVWGLTLAPDKVIYQFFCQLFATLFVISMAKTLHVKKLWGHYLSLAIEIST